MKIVHALQEEILGEHGFNGGLLPAQPMLHVNAYGILRQSTSAMKADGLPFGCSGSEIGADLYTECSILSPWWCEM